jgi:FkbM family methyltransferase
MALDNVGSILNSGSSLTSFKLLLMQGSLSRPGLRWLFHALLRPFVRDGRIAVTYRCHNRTLTSYVRVSELESDYYSTRELGVDDVYSLEPAFHPDLVIDGGGNIGLFTLRAKACLEAAGDASARFVICEPVPQNVAQIRQHLALNRMQAEIQDVCLGGSHSTIPFYCREANQSSFESAKPYTHVLSVPVVTLRDVIDPRAERILIKLDIEGMEVEALSAYIPREDRPVYLVGELHQVSRNAPHMERLFRAFGWTLELIDISHDTCNFRGCSPAAQHLLPSFASLEPASLEPVPSLA